MKGRLGTGGGSLLLLLLLVIDTGESVRWPGRRQKRDDGALPDPTVTILEEAVRAIPITQFNDDPYLLQTIDRINSITSYHSPTKVSQEGGKEGDLVYERTANDKDKDVIVLSPGEDKVSLKAHSTKQTYVVLRRDPRSLSPTYYAAFAYIRNATSLDPSPVTIKGESKAVEWDLWEDRTAKKPVFWTTCASSILVACGFNIEAFGKYGIGNEPHGVNASSSHSTPSAGGGDHHHEGENHTHAMPSVNKEDEEFEMDNYDFYDDLNIDMVHGRAAMVPDSAGTLGGGSANIGCGMVGAIFGGTCGGGKLKKTIIIKKGATVYPINGLPPMGGNSAAPGPPAIYMPLGTPGLAALPPHMSATTPQITTGIFYPDNRQIPPVDGTMVPFGPKKPFLYQANAATFPSKLPGNKGTTGSYAPPGKPPVHGIMCPVAGTQGIFIPDGMAVPSQFNPTRGGTGHTYAIPGFPGHPDVVVPDDMNSPIIAGVDANTPVPGTLIPDPATNLAATPTKVGQLIHNKMPPEFIPSNLNPTRSIFTDDAHKLPPIAGILIPAAPGLPEVFLPDNEEFVKGLKPPPSGMMTPVAPSPKAPEHGILFPGPVGADPLFIPDNAGDNAVFTPASPAERPSDGILIPANTITVNDYHPNQPCPKKPQVIPGVMTFPGSKTGRKCMPGNLIANKYNAPIQFLPNGMGTQGMLKPTDGRPPVRGIWVAGFPTGKDEFIPLDEPSGGLPAMAGTFIDDRNPAAPYPCTLGQPTRPGGPPTITNAPPAARPPPNIAPAPPTCPGSAPPAAAGMGPGGPTITAAGPPPGRFIPDQPLPGGAPSPMNPVAPPAAGKPIAFNPSAPFPPGRFPRGVAEIPGLDPQHGHVIPPASPGGPATFVPDPPGTTPGIFTPDNNPGAPSLGYVGPPSPPHEGEPTKFTPDNPAEAPKMDNPGSLTVPGNTPVKGVLHPAPYEGAPCPFTPYSPATFIPDRNPEPIRGSVPPNLMIPDGNPTQEVPFYPEYPGQVPQGSYPQRGKLTRPRYPTANGILKPPVGPKTAVFVPDPMNSKPCDVIPDNNQNNPASGSCSLPYNPSDPIAFRPDDRNQVPPRDNKGKVSVPGGLPPEYRGTIHNPPNPAEAVLIYPDKPAIFQPFSPAGVPPIPGFKEDPKTPGGPLKFYPSDPSQLGTAPQPGVLSAPMDPTFQPMTGLLRPDYPPPAYSFEPFPPGTFAPDDTRAPHPGAVQVPRVPGEVPNFYPRLPSPLQPGPIQGTLQQLPTPGQAPFPEQKGTLQPSTSGNPGGPRPFHPSLVPDNPVTFYPDEQGRSPVMGNSPPYSSPTEQSPFYPKMPTLMPPGFPKGALVYPDKPSRRGTMEPKATQPPSWVFKPDAPDSVFSPAQFPGTQVPGSTSPGSPIPFYPQNPGQVPPGGPLKGTLQQPGQPLKHGDLLPPSGPGQPHRFQEEPSSIFYPDKDPYNPVNGACDRPQDLSKSFPFSPHNPGQNPKAQTVGTVKTQGNPDIHGYLDVPKGGPPIFYPDPPGTKPATFFPDRNPTSGVDGMLSPEQGPGKPATFRPTDPSKLLPNADDHGKTVPKGDPAETGTLVPSPGNPWIWNPDPEGVIPAWFHPDDSLKTPIKGLYYPPADGNSSPKFKPNTNGAGPKKDEHGQMKKENHPPEVGTLQPVGGDGKHPFIPDSKDGGGEGQSAIFYPDIKPGLDIILLEMGEGESQITGVYHPPNSPNTPGQFVPKGKIFFHVPSPGMMSVAKMPNSHGILKPPAFPNMPYLFGPESMGNVPEVEVSLVPQGSGTVPDKKLMNQSSTVIIKGTYFKSTITTELFIAFTGTAGVFVRNSVPPADPKAEKLYCTFVPQRHPDSDAATGTAIVTPQAKPGHLDPSQVPPGQKGVFYPDGVTACGISGQLDAGTQASERIFRPISPAEVGSWKNDGKSGCFMFTDTGKLIPFDMEFIKKRDAEYAKPQVQTRAFNFQGKAQPDKWDIYMPIEGSSPGKFQVGNSQTVIHGSLKPAEAPQVTSATFTPDDPMLLKNLISSQGSLTGSFEQDDTPVSTGIFPNNGVAGTIAGAGGAFTMTFSSPGRKGNLLPGKKPSPGFYVYCIGIVENVHDSAGNEVVSNPVHHGENLLKGRSISRKKGPSGRSMGGYGRSLSRSTSSGGQDPSLTTSEHMSGRSMMNQDFSSYLATHANEHDGTPPQINSDVTRQQMEQMRAMGGIPMTPEQIQAKLSPEMIHQLPPQFQHAFHEGFHITERPSAQGGRGFTVGDKLEEVKGVTYLSSTMGRVFVPDEDGSRGVLYIDSNHIDLPSASLIGVLVNKEGDPECNKGNFESEKIGDLVEGLKKYPTMEGIFVPNPQGGPLGGVQVTLALDAKNMVELTLLYPGSKGTRQMKREKKALKDESSKADETPTIHGTVYKVSPKEVFMADYPGTKGVFFSNGVTPLKAKGTLFPPVQDSKELFWSSDEGLASSIPSGGELSVVGKFVPANNGASGGDGEDEAGLSGTLKATAVAHVYAFKPDVVGESGLISKGEAIKAKGRGIGDSAGVYFAADSSVDLSDHPGWKTQFEVVVPNITLKYDEDIFFGFGNCPRRGDLNPGVLAKAETDDAVLDFYMGLLRTYCLPEHKKYVAGLVAEGYIQVKKSLVVLAQDSKFLTLPKLTKHETEKLSAAFELVVFSLTYADEVKKGTSLDYLVTPGGKRISRSVKYLSDMTILSLKMARELARLHSVRLSRNVVMSLTTALVKVNQDLKAVSNCEGCTLDKEILHSDSMEIMGLTQFIIHGLSSIESGDSIRGHFETFYNVHEKLIHKKVLQVQAIDD